MEKQKKIRLSVDLTESMYSKVKAISVDCGLPMSSIVTYAIMTFLDQRDAINMMDLYKKTEKEKIINGKK